MSKLLQKAQIRNQWTPECHGEVKLLRSPLLKSVDFAVHAFSTRVGGKSKSPLDSFNLGRHWPDQESKEDAMCNRRSLLRIFELDADTLLVPGQKHTANVQVLQAGSASLPEPSQLQAIDAVACSRRKQPVLLHFADCVPVILVDSSRRSLAVIHSGWRGTASGIVRKTLELMCSELESRAKNVFAAIGPAIGPCCFETDREVPEALDRSVENGAAFREFKNGKAYCDLKSYVASQLLESGVEELDISAECTSCLPELFYSHRRSAGQTGRQGAFACLL